MEDERVDDVFENTPLLNRCLMMRQPSFVAEQCKKETTSDLGKTLYQQDCQRGCRGHFRWPCLSRSFFIAIIREDISAPGAGTTSKCCKYGKVPMKCH